MRMHTYLLNELLQLLDFQKNIVKKTTDGGPENQKTARIGRHNTARTAECDTKDQVMPMYNLLYYNKNYSKTKRFLLTNLKGWSCFPKTCHTYASFLT